MDDFYDDVELGDFNKEKEDEDGPVNPDIEAVESPDEDAKKLNKALKAAKKNKSTGTKKKRVFNELDLIGANGYRKLFSMVKDIKLPKETEVVSSRKFCKDVTAIEDKFIAWANEMQPNMKFSEFCGKCQMLNKKKVVLDCIKSLVEEFYPKRNSEVTPFNNDVFNTLIGLEWRVVDDDIEEIKDFEKKYSETDEYFKNYVGVM
ncbi:Replication fork protection component Swi3 domain-containing protein [Strongyloides ratti]|uniref:Replication fork protection component Swi3 domain-containing protein n=1 Tax=Strongyloides ratti TaxID=34506 RepID=A0A090LG47_STRRB|nr:Replication fork protection component Swi3 domain-containing protein [Strongyloides ratti]CEF66495.1 Replication fork protection component Swi3 domain-containing protein [Strongyloides ratti]